MEDWLKKIRESTPIVPTYGLKSKNWVSRKEICEGLLRIGTTQFQNAFYDRRNKEFHLIFPDSENPNKTFIFKKTSSFEAWHQWIRSIVLMKLLKTT